MPFFGWIGKSLKTLTAGRCDYLTCCVYLDRIRGAPNYVDSCSVRRPTGELTAKLLIRNGDAPIMLYFEPIVRFLRVRRAPIPKLLNEVGAFFVGPQMKKGAMFSR